MTDVIFGAGSGIGAAFAETVAERGTAGEGWLLVDRNVDAASGVAARLGLTKASVMAADLSDQASLAAFADHVESLGALILTAGVSPSMAPGAVVLDVDLVGVARLLDLLEPKLTEGSVAVLTASMAAHFAPEIEAVDAELDDPLGPDLLGRLATAGIDANDPANAYVFAKRGVIRQVRRRVGAWGAKGARIVSVSPGNVDTPMGQQELAAQTGMQALLDMSPLKRLAQPRELADVMAFLAGPQAGFLTGTDVLVDGGVVAALGRS